VSTAPQAADEKEMKVLLDTGITPYIFARLN